jgi:micrococcal nuclease
MMRLPRRIGCGLLVLGLIVGLGLGALEQAGWIPPELREAVSGMLGAEEGEVTRVVDGDTLIVHGTGKVRIIGIDTMDSQNQERVAEQSDYYGLSPAEVRKWSERATDYVREHAEGRVVRLQFGPDRQDRYGRTLAYVHLPDGTDLGVELISNGLASAYRKFDHPRKELYLIVESTSQARRDGFWEVATTGE